MNNVKIPTPKTGKGTVSGRVMSTNNQPYQNVPVRLATVYRQVGEGTFILDLAHSPGSFSDQNGFFVIPDVDPAEYTIVIGDPDAKHVVVADDKENATIWKVEIGKVLDTGTLKIDLEK